MTECDPFGLTAPRQMTKYGRCVAANIGASNSSKRSSGALP